MKLLAFLLLAAASEDLIPGVEGFDLKEAKRPDRCAETGSDAIIVCGRRKKADEIIVKNPGQFESGPLRAETGFLGGKLDVHGEQHGFPDGRSAPAAMLRFTIPF